MKSMVTSQFPRPLRHIYCLALLRTILGHKTWQDSFRVITSRLHSPQNIFFPMATLPAIVIYFDTKYQSSETNKKSQNLPNYPVQLARLLILWCSIRPLPAFSFWYKLKKHYSKFILKNVNNQQAEYKKHIELRSDPEWI